MRISVTGGKRHRIILSGFILSFLGMVSSEAAAQRPTPGGTLTIALSAEPPGLDPTTNPAATIKRVVHYNLLEGLLKVDRNGKGGRRPWRKATASPRTERSILLPSTRGSNFMTASPARPRM